MSEIKCPYDLNQFILGEPIFENPFPKEECEKRKFYGDCYHCFSTAIASRDHQLKALAIKSLEELQAHREAWEKCIKEIKEWYWNADKQAIAKDPCVVDAMIDLFIRTIEKNRPKEGNSNDN